MDYDRTKTCTEPSEIVSKLESKMIIAFNKPYGVLSAFTPDGSTHQTLAEFGFPKDVYPIGRLDADSEGLLLLSDQGELNQLLLHPRRHQTKTYHAQVERVPSEKALLQLQKGVLIQGYRTLPCRAQILDPQPEYPPRDPPIRFRKEIPACWMSLDLHEGKNRQVRRMTAAVDHPTLRLIRVAIGGLGLEGIAVGSWKTLCDSEIEQLMT